MMMILRRLSVVVAAAFLTGCASRSNAPVSGRERLETTVVVDNQALLDMNVYVLRGGQRVRLGLATGLSKTRFTIPQGIVFGATGVRFLADPVGSSRTPVSEEIVLSEGDEVTLRIPPA